MLLHYSRHNRLYPYYGHNYNNSSVRITLICQVFSKMTSNIRFALFQVLMVMTVENENTVVVENGEDVSRDIK